MVFFNLRYSKPIGLLHDLFKHVHFDPRSLLGLGFRDSLRSVQGGRHLANSSKILNTGGESEVAEPVDATHRLVISDSDLTGLGKDGPRNLQPLKNHQGTAS